jgi:hypothetical protein
MNRADGDLSPRRRKRGTWRRKFDGPVTGLARSTIYHGLSDIRNNVAAAPGRIRKAGGGRKKKAFEDPILLGDLKALVVPVTRGDPMRPLLWTCRSFAIL